MTTSLDDIVANFELLDEWDDRYRYLIELGKGLEPRTQQSGLRSWQATDARPNEFPAPG
jgi:sulfur transfer protein SufE